MDPIWIALAVAVVLALWAATRAGRVSDEVLEALTAGTPVLDVRTPGEFDDGHVKGAVNIPVEQLGKRLKELGQPGRIILYCRSGARSNQAAAMLKQAGFEVLDAGSLRSFPAEWRV